MKATDVDEPQPPKGEVALLTDRPTDLPTPQNTHTPTTGEVFEVLLKIIAELLKTKQF